jgi:hypothetical protein
MRNIKDLRGGSENETGFNPNIDYMKIETSNRL